MEKESFGASEFKVVCSPKQVKLIIHGNWIVAKSDKDVYNEIFEFAVKKLGGRIDKSEIRYVILDEISLLLVVEHKGNTKLFNNKEEAIKYAEGSIQSWQIIEIPFN